MKNQKIRQDIIYVMARSTFGSTHRNDELAHLKARYRITTGKLRTIALGGGGKCDYWNA